MKLIIFVIKNFNIAKPKDFAKLLAAPLTDAFVGKFVFPSIFLANFVGFKPMMLTVPSNPPFLSL